MDILRTPEERFTSLPGFDFKPCYVDVEDLRIAYVDEGPPDGRVVLLLHGEPSWSFLYRTMIPPLASAGYRAIAIDLVGFGRSDKPTQVRDHTYERHVGWLREVVEFLDLTDITLVCQDWGGLLGLRLAAEAGDRFSAVVAANTGLPTGDHPMPDAWLRFANWVAKADELPISFLVNSGCVSDLAPDVLAAYDAPFPDESYKAGPRAMPAILPTSPDDPAAPANRAAWEALMAWDKPFVCAFSDSDPITRDAGPLFEQLVPGAKGQHHPTITGAGHFLQEDAGDQLAAVVLDVLRRV
jgi:haloalkane dehalogenase